MQTLEKKLNFEQLNDSKFDAMNLQEIEKIVGGYSAPKREQGSCTTIFSDDTSNLNDED